MSILSRPCLQDQESEAHACLGEVEAPASAYVQDTALIKSPTVANTSMDHVTMSAAAPIALLQQPCTAATESTRPGVKEASFVPWVRMYWDADAVPFKKPIYTAIFEKLYCSRVCSPGLSWGHRNLALLTCFPVCTLCTHDTHSLIVVLPVCDTYVPFFGSVLKGNGALARIAMRVCRFVLWKCLHPQRLQGISARLRIR
jgi:hypothetical protein